jgi:anaerobic magnesium-protoporphyrin IX monomethyl ester cyclase
VEDFDMVVMGEAENTVLDITENLFKGIQLDGIQGTVFRDENGVHHAERRAPIANLDSIPFPARELFDNKAYKQYYSRRFGRAMTSIISSRGCTFTCDFCSRPVFGGTFRSRSPGNIVDEMKSIVNLGYDTVWFADDCFTMSKDRVMRICDEIIERDLKIKWQCLSRADTLDREMASRMKEAGCQRIYFGIEAGDDRILRIMKKDLDLQIAAEAVRNANSANVETGAFFIIGYPGDDDESVLNTIEFATSLPLDYLSFTLPYPIPGTGLHEKVKHVLKEPSKRKINLIDQQLIFHSEFSESKLKFAIVKAAVQFRIRKYLGAIGYGIFGRPFAELTNAIFRLLK